MRYQHFLGFFYGYRSCGAASGILNRELFRDNNSLHGCAYCCHCGFANTRTAHAARSCGAVIDSIFSVAAQWRAPLHLVTSTCSSDAAGAKKHVAAQSYRCRPFSNVLPSSTGPLTIFTDCSGNNAAFFRDRLNSPKHPNRAATAVTREWSWKERSAGCGRCACCVHPQLQIVNQCTLLSPLLTPEKVCPAHRYDVPRKMAKTCCYPRGKSNFKN